MALSSDLVPGLRIGNLRRCVREVAVESIRDNDFYIGNQVFGTTLPFLVGSLWMLLMECFYVISIFGVLFMVSYCGADPTSRVVEDFLP